MMFLGSDREYKGIRLERHPCFSDSAHMKWGRIHLAVAPMCNISCKYCLRALNKIEDRPGVTAEIITPEKALILIEDAKKIYPITVAGIAGPGESLANKQTFQTFELVDKQYPDLMKCLATNGLLLSESIGELKLLRVNTITVTVNTLSAETGKNIYNFVNYNGKTYKEKDAAEILIQKQIEGVKEALKAGFIIKINTVFIPDVNNNEMEDIARFYSNLGVEIMNIMPLIPIHEMSDKRAPTCSELSDARGRCEIYVKQFKKCKQCRADAVGVPGLENKCSQCSTEYFHG
jgi:nitrogen fixation protein NifB